MEKLLLVIRILCTLEFNLPLKLKRYHHADVINESLQYHTVHIKNDAFNKTLVR